MEGRVKVGVEQGWPVYRTEKRLGEGPWLSQVLFCELCINEVFSMHSEGVSRVCLGEAILRWAQKRMGPGDKPIQALN